MGRRFDNPFAVPPLIAMLGRLRQRCNEASIEFLNVPNIPPSFWTLLAEARPSLRVLEAELGELSQSRLESFIVSYAVASDAIREPSEGIDIDGVGILSEDSTEDFCEWIVSQGESVWQYARSSEASLTALFERMETGGRLESYQLSLWSNEVAMKEHRGYQAPKALAIITLQERFGVDYYSDWERIHDEQEL